MKPATRRDSTMVQGHYGYYKLKQTFQKQSEERKRYAFGVFKCQWIFATFFHPLTVTYRCYFFTVVWFHPFHQSFLIRSDCRHNDSFGRELQILGSCRVSFAFCTSCRWAMRLQEKKEACKREAHESYLVQSRIWCLHVQFACFAYQEFSYESWQCQTIHLCTSPTSRNCWTIPAVAEGPGSWFVSDCSMWKVECLEFWWGT